MIAKLIHSFHFLITSHLRNERCGVPITTAGGRVQVATPPRLPILAMITNALKLHSGLATVALNYTSYSPRVSRSYLELFGRFHSLTFHLSFSHLRLLNPRRNWHHRSYSRNATNPPTPRHGNPDGSFGSRPNRACTCMGHGSRRGGR